MNKKTLVTILFFNFLCLFNSCKCPPERYFDYKRLRVEAILDSRLLIRVNPEEIEYLAKNTTIAFGGCAYATSVCEKGYDGEKYPVIKVRVYSNSDFNDNYPAGTDLADLIKVACYRDGKDVMVFLKDVSFGENFNPWYLNIEEKPATIGKKHIFTVEFEKSNGEIVSGISQEIIWE